MTPVEPIPMDFDPFDFIDDEWTEIVVAVGKELPGGGMEKSAPMRKIGALADRLRKGRRG